MTPYPQEDCYPETEKEKKTNIICPSNTSISGGRKDNVFSITGMGLLTQEGLALPAQS